MTFRSLSRFFFGAACLFFVLFAPLAQGETLDRLFFGNFESEAAHGWHTDAKTQAFPANRFGRTARQILPPEPENWTTDGVFFTLKIRPEGINYLTFCFPGNTDSSSLLILYVGGKQIGYRHLGDYDILHHGGSSAGGERPCYITTCLPESLTRGQTSLELELRMTGRIWGYGVNFEQFQKVIETPSPLIFEAATHTEPTYDEMFLENTQNVAPDIGTLPVRTSPGTEILEQIQARTNQELIKLLERSRTRPLTQQEAELLAKGWSMPGSPVFHDPGVLPAVIAAADEYCRCQRETESLAWSDPRQYNSDWFGTGPLAEAIFRMDSQELQHRLDETLEFSDGTAPSRREAWGALLEKGVRWETEHRRQFTNQCMIIDWNIQRMNRALRLIAPSRALPEAQVRRYLYESVGLKPWLGPETPDGPARPMGDDFYQTTPQGLTRELGYVGSYGEVMDWGALIYLSTCKFDADGALDPTSGDPEIRDQLAKMAHARSFFRYPAPDEEGFRAMRLETGIGWRDTSLIGPVMYGTRSGKEGAASWLPWVVRTEESIAAFGQMLDDGQFFPVLAELLKDRSLRMTNALMDVPAQYAWLTAELEKLRKTAHKLPRLPMSPGEPDVTFTDETDGVAVLRCGDEILYVSLYWRARFGVNDLSKVHYISPRFEHFATIRNQTRFTPMEGGTAWERPNWTTFGFRPDWGVHYPERFDSVHAGERLPVAKMPDSVPDFQLGKDNIFAGRGDFMEIRYGDWFVRMDLRGQKTKCGKTGEKKLGKEAKAVLQ